MALGSNLGDRSGLLATARRRLAALPSTRLLGASAVEETLPLLGQRQPAYLNQMVALETTLEPERLLEACLAIEKAAGRERGERWASRTLDLDVVRYGEVTADSPTLTLPHPALAERDFWRRELDELSRLGL